MARRIKEEPFIHRNRILDAAGKLFEQKGAGNTSMDDIAKTAGYSKATIYVYFKNKDEIVAYLVLTSMIKLKEYLSQALDSNKSFKSRYFDICNSMVRYEEEYPYYFSMALDRINIDFEHSPCAESEREIFNVGEDIIEILTNFFISGMKQGAFIVNMNIKAVIFSIWGMLSGLIQLSSKKQKYIESEIKMTKKVFLESGFELLYEAFKRK